jgi:hypothetical protein
MSMGYRTLAVLFLAVFCCAPGILSRAEAAPRVLVDQGHEQRFLVDQEGPLQLSGLAAVLKEEGLELAVGTAPLSDGALEGVQALIISGPFKRLDPGEVEAVLRFLSRGGRLAVMLHIASPFAELLRRLEVDFTNYVLFEQEQIIDNDRRNFRVSRFGTDPLFAGLSHFSLYGGWALMNTGEGARIIATTSPAGWVDLDGDQQVSARDAVQAFGVVVAGAREGGRFVVFGDDAIFQNRFLDEQNRLLARNLARWLR